MSFAGNKLGMSHESSLVRDLRAATKAAASRPKKHLPMTRKELDERGIDAPDIVLVTGDAYVDLGGAVVTGHTGGSLDEALTVYAIVNALAANLPGVSTVQILIEGQEVDSLVGHLDLRHPLGRALDWVRKGP